MSQGIGSEGEAAMDEIEHPTVEEDGAELAEVLEPVEEDEVTAEELEEALTVHVVEGDGAAAYVAAREVTAILAAAQGEDGVASLALTGGSTPRGLYETLTRDEFRDLVDWTRVEIFWGDERAVPADSADSNYRLAEETLLHAVAPPQARIHRIEGELGAETAAVRYGDELNAVLGDDPRFDLILLGLGSDGHVASLFPVSEEHDDEALGGDGWQPGETRRVAATTSPAGVAERVTLTLPVLNAAHHVLFLVTGEGKAEAVARVLGGDASRPGAHVQPADGAVLWVLDTDAASGLLTAVEELEEPPS